MTWDQIPDDGPLVVAVYLNNVLLTGWEDVDSQAGDTSDPLSVTIDTAIGHLVIKFDQRNSDTTSPTLSSGWTDGITGANNFAAFRTSSIVATGATQVANSEDEVYSGLCAVSLPPVPTTVTRRMVGGFFG